MPVLLDEYRCACSVDFRRLSNSDGQACHLLNRCNMGGRDVSQLTAEKKLPGTGSSPNRGTSKMAEIILLGILMHGEMVRPKGV